MKKITLLIAIMLLVVTGSYAQASLYTFAQSSGTYVPITGGTVVTSAISNAGTPNPLDSYASAAITFPTSFKFSGTVYTTFFVTSNGQITLGGSAPSTTNYASLSSSFGSNVVFAPFSADMSVANLATGEIRYQQVGNELIVQWTNFRRYNVAESFNIQARLNTATGVISYVYDGNPPFAASTSFQPQVGIKSATGTGGYLAFTGTTWNAPTAITTGIAGTSTMTINDTVGFTTGLTYTFTPPAGCGPAVLAGGTSAPATSLVCTGVIPGAITVTGATNNTYSGVAYQWQQSINSGTTWTDVAGGTGANTLVYTPVAFSGTATQYRLKVSCSGSDVFSSVATVSVQIAPTTQVTALTVTAANTFNTSFTASWTSGNGGRRVVVVSPIAIVDPVNGNAPVLNANNVYSGSGQQIVYDGTGTGVTVYGLLCNSAYNVKVYEYNRCGSGPYDYYYNTITGTNALAVTTKTLPAAVGLPVANSFTGFTGTNLATVVTGWYEAAVPTAALAIPILNYPGGSTSAWTNASVFTGVTSAKVNLNANTKNEWIVSPKMNIVAASRIRFKAAITDVGVAIPDQARMIGTDDKVRVMISSDGCGGVWTTLYTFDASNTTTLTNVLQDFIVTIPATYNGQTVQIAFLATDGTIDDAPDYDFHIANINIEDTPSCETPTVAATTNITKNSATINWSTSATGVTGYEYVVSTANTAPAGAGTAVTATTANVTTLTPLTTYYVFVRTVCGATFTAWSNSVTFTTLCSNDVITGTTPALRCGPGNVTLNATTGAGSVVHWFDAATGGNMLASGNALTTPATATTTFYAAAATIGTGTTTIGTGTGVTSSTEEYTSFNNRWPQYRMQLVYTAAELNAAGLFAGNITTIAFNTISLGDGATNSNFTVMMGAYATGTFPNTTFIATGLNTVYGPVTHTHTGSGWQTITLTTPYAWDGTSNIIIEVSHLGANATYNAMSYFTPTTGNTVLYSRAAAPTTGTLETRRLDIMFGGQAACRSSRTAVVATVNTPSVITLSGNPAAVCPGQSTTAVTITSGVSTYDTYVWTPSVGVTGNATTGWTFNPAVSTIYSLQASESTGSMCNATPVTVNVTINALPSANISLPATASVCQQSTQVLTISSAVGALTATFGNGTTAPGVLAYPNPFSAYYGGTKTQILFTSDELIAQGLTPGTVISTLSFDFNTSAANALNDFRIKIGSTANANTTAGFVASTSLTTVYNASYTPTAGATGLVPFTLSTPYTWTGGNLIIEIAHNQGNGGNGSGTTTNTTQTAFNSVYTGAKDSTTPEGLASYDALTSWSISTASDLRPNVVFGYTSTNTVAWSPATNLYTDAAATVPYSGQSIATVYTKPTANITYTATVSNVAGCQRVKTVAVTLIVTPAPTVAAPTQDICNAGTVANLVATGTAIKWYAAATGGAPLASTVALVNGTTYYASQTATSCESVARTALTANINVVAAPAIANAAQTFCNAGTVAELLPNGAAIKWYAAATGGTALASTVALVNGTTYYASQTVNGCEGLVRGAVTATINVIAAPAISNNEQVFCNAATVADLLPNGAEIKWYAAATGGTALLSTDALVSGTTYYASQTVNGCEGLVRGIVTATVLVTPAPVINNTDQVFCNAATVADLTPNDASIKWYAAATGGTALASTDALVSGTHYFASQTADGCEGLVRTDVTATVNVTSTPTADNEQEFCDAAIVDNLVAQGNAIIWYADETGGSALAGDVALANGVMYYAAQVIDGCESLGRFGVTAVIHTVVADAPADVDVCTEYVLPTLTSGAYFTQPAGAGIELAAGSVITETTTLYVYAEEGTDVVCSDENTFVVTVANVQAPTGDATQTITADTAADATIADLQTDTTTGTVTWYASEAEAQAGTNPLAADMQLVQGVTYYATQTVGTCTSEDVFAVTVDLVLDRADFDIKSFTYYPNPVKDVLNLSYSSEITSVTVFNLLGQRVIAQQSNATEVKVDMSALADGAYVVNVTMGNTVKTVKVIKRQ